MIREFGRSVQDVFALLCVSMGTLEGATGPLLQLCLVRPLVYKSISYSVWPALFVI